mgnify:FL=1
MEKQLFQHGAAALLAVVAYQLLTGCGFVDALSAVSLYLLLLMLIVSIDVWWTERGQHG